MTKRPKDSEPSEPDRAVGMVKLNDPASSSDPPHVYARPEPPPAPPRAASGPGFADRVGRFFRFLLRLVLLLFFLGVLSLVLYLTLPWLYQRFIRPVEQNTVEVRQLQTQQEQTEQEMADLQDRLEAMENGQNQNGESFTELDERLTALEEEISARTESLETLERTLADLEGQSEANSVELEQQINLLKAMELLSRARLSMYQSNFGLAREDVQIARDLLATVQVDAPESRAEELKAVMLRLDMVLSNLPAFPVAAADDLDIAWQILLSGLPEEGTPTVTVTLTPVGSASPTPSAADVSGTPTPQASAQPTATP
ncbi:MAG TPA: hypothetical protein VJ830_07950 [Anaerolineales bacterium]|nr:hypothetical protein [Anaerolineales bacterium]